MVNKQEWEVDLAKLGRKWPSALVARECVREFTGGLFSPQRMANLDAQGLGPKGRVKIGKKVAYDVDSLIEWLQEKIISMN